MKELKIKNSDKTISVGKIVCVGRNYAAHAKELGNEVLEFPLIFLKPPSSLIFSGGTVIHPVYSKEMHHEVELVLLIGNTIKDADDDSAEDAISGFGVGLDMTLRDLQADLKSKGHPWTLAKCFDTSAVISEIILKKDYKITGTERIKLKVNNEMKQDSFLSNMIFSPNEIIKYISSKMMLEKGDLVYTGTPAGVSKLKRGDSIYAEIDNVGSLTVNVM